MGIGFPRRCRAPGCWDPTRAQCFECERPFCEAHVARVRITSDPAGTVFQLCADCLRAALAEPEIREVARLEPPPQRE